MPTEPAPLGPLDTFPRRHLGSSADQIAQMLEMIGYPTLDALIDATVPADIRLTESLELPGTQPELGERGILARLKQVAGRNRVLRSKIGMGYHGTITPPIILRSMLENPLWYTPYTPYQAEISQGRLESLLNFQTMVTDLTGLDVAGASLLDEGTAAAEAMFMCHSISRQKREVFRVVEGVHPQTLGVLRTRADAMGIRIELVSPAGLENLSDETLAEASGLLIQVPNTLGEIGETPVLQALADRVHAAGGLMVCATDPLALTRLDPPASWGADIAVGSTQRFGVPMGYGGPHAAFLACRQEHARRMPGRLVGVSKDAHGQLAFRLAIQTREQHIKRDRATSNICTAQALLANIAAMYAVYHGPAGLTAIATRITRLLFVLAEGYRRAFAAGGVEAEVQDAGIRFDTITLRLPTRSCVLEALQKACDLGYNLRDLGDERLGISLDETTTFKDVRALWQVAEARFSPEEERAIQQVAEERAAARGGQRAEPFLTHPVFQRYHTEHELLRYITSLQEKDLSLCEGMIPLGSCTMKLNAAVQMIPITWPEFAELHPFCPADQAEGYRQVLTELEEWLARITGFAATSLQPNAGSQGEFAGLLAIRRFHESRGESARDVCLIPTSAHGTNPASAVVAGMRVVPVGCLPNGDIDLEDLRAKAAAHADTLAALMITYPSTHGVFETGVTEACQVIHEHGGLVYMDGANMNAQVGLTSPGRIGADVCHLNLHKTFCIPHGGGGPGMGPICCTEALRPFLPGHPADPEARAVSAAPFGSAMILPISWVYVALMGGAGLTEATKVAILNANYMARRLEGHYATLYTGPSGTCAHEFIADCRPFEKSAQVTVEDIAKRLMDYGFHAPTMSWPVAGTLMIEPTESESKAELDRFCDAMIAIRKEIAAIEQGAADSKDNPLKHAPHTAAAVTADHWPHAYGREMAAYPLPYLRQRKYWPSVGRIDNAYGDRNLVCTCPPLEAYCDA